MVRNFLYFPHNLALVSVLYSSEQPEMTPHDEESKEAKQKKKITNPKRKKRMKTKLTKRSVRGVSMALLVSAGMLLLVTVTQGRDPGGKLEGAWNVTVNVCNNGPTLTRLNTFIFGGTMQEYAAFVSPPLVSPRGPGHGVWEHAADRLILSVAI